MKIIVMSEETTDGIAPTDGVSPELPQDVVPPEMDTPVDTPTHADNGKALPPPPRSNYEYNIVPYYIPVGFNPYRRTRRGYRDTLSLYPDSFHGSKNFILRDYEEGEFDFTDDTPGVYAKSVNIMLSAGSESGRKNIVKVKIGKDKYMKSFKTVGKTKRLFSKLADALYHDKEQFFALLLKYNFTRL